MTCGNIDLACAKCRLSKGRTQVVPGIGSCSSRIVFVGEAPGKDEDLRGEPFVGRAGKILTAALEELGVDRADVYISNAVKCRPPDNRRPRQDEIETCRPYLDSELAEVRPAVICALGQTAAIQLLNNKKRISELIGKSWETSVSGRKVRLIVAYHPAACLYGRKKLAAFKGQISASLKAAKMT